MTVALNRKTFDDAGDKPFVGRSAFVPRVRIVASSDRTPEPGDGDEIDCCGKESMSDLICAHIYPYALSFDFRENTPAQDAPAVFWQQKSKRLCDSDSSSISDLPISRNQQREA
jgi:hypothetical protein